MARVCCRSLPTADQKLLRRPATHGRFYCCFPPSKYVLPFLAYLYDRMVELSLGNHFRDKERLNYSTPPLTFGKVVHERNGYYLSNDQRGKTAFKCL